MKPVQLKGAIFDLDGVITQTARVHFKAWKSVFDEAVKKHAQNESDKQPFTHEGDYLPYVDGKPRYDGVQSFLESRHISLPYGEQSDTGDNETICGIGNRKNDRFREIIAAEGVEIYEPAVDFIKTLKKEGIKLGVASSSKNCRYILEKIGLIDMFGVIIGGIVSKEMGLRGKPNPDIFVAAAEKLGLKPAECLMVEDALVGVEAGRNGNFGLVIGLPRHGTAESLLANGADIAVSSMTEMPYSRVLEWFERGIVDDSWNLTYHDFKPDSEKLRETLTTVGNGYLGTRGCFAGAVDTDDIHYPGTYIAGIYNKIPTKVADRDIYNNDLVNCPNWLLIELKIGDGDYLRINKETIIANTQTLNMKDAIVSRKITIKDTDNRITTIETQHFASMENPHSVAVKYTVTPENYSDTLTLRSALDGTVINNGVPRYRALNAQHLAPVKTEYSKDGFLLEVETTASHYHIFMAAKNTLRFTASAVQSEEQDGFIAEVITFDAQQNTAYTCEKLVSIYTSLDNDINNPETEAKNAVKNIKSFDESAATHKNAWRSLWDIADYDIDGDRFAQKTLRLHIYHLLCTASLHNTGIDAGMPARGLSGEAYRGHIFWDELYVFPFFNLHFPDITRSLLLYRYNRLNDARAYAQENGYAGAMYPWQTADGGEEETQTLHYNPVSKKWGPDLSRRQRHVSIAIFYNVYKYYTASGDEAFLKEYGLEMMLEIARFWASIAEPDNNGKYHINGVMGPDEFHEKYPGKSEEEGGINDNAYTNVMVSWLLHYTHTLLNTIDPAIKDTLLQKLGFSNDETDKWIDISTNLHLIINDDGIIEQYDGFFDLAELDWEQYRKQYNDIHRMDRILKAEGKSPDDYKVIKQADTLMMFYTFTPDTVRNVLKTMGKQIADTKTFIEKNFDYYYKRTSHGSTLSHVVHAAVLKYIDNRQQDMWDKFLHALKSDVSDTQGGTTKEGIHCGVMAGTLDIVIESFAGIEITDNAFIVKPALPQHWEHLAFTLVYRGNHYAFDITKDTITAECKINGAENNILQVMVNETVYSFDSQKKITAQY